MGLCSNMIAFLRAVITFRDHSVEQYGLSHSSEHELKTTPV